MNKTILLFSLVLLLAMISCETRITTESEKTWDFDEVFTTKGRGWTGGDGVYSVPLADGRSIFVFGDTYLGEVTDDNSRVNTTPAVKNSLVVFNQGNIETIIGPEDGKKPQPYFQTTNPNSTWFWPGHGYEHNGVLSFFLAEFKATGSGIFGFEWTGTSIATVSTNDLGKNEPVIETWEHGTDIHFGMATLVEGEYIYAFGIKAFRVYVARSKVGTNSNWQYWDGNQWVTEANSAQPLDGVYASEQFSLFKHKNDFYILSQGAMLGKEIFIYKSASLTSGWSKPVEVFSTPEPVADSTLITYNALAHPEFSSKDSLLISYCVNSSDFLSIYKDVNRYRPRFFRISINAIDTISLKSDNP